MPDYSKTVIYQISSKDESIQEKYIGHSTDLKYRIKDHYKRCNGDKVKKDFKVYEFIRNNGGWDNWVVELILVYPCKTKNEAKLKEREYIEALGNNALNMCIPMRTASEWYYDNRDRLLKSHTEYQKNNKEKVANYPCNTKESKSKFNKEYRAEHRDQLVAYSNKYNDEHKDETNRKRREKSALKRNEKALKLSIESVIPLEIV
jgi:hypothetical protein